MNEHEAEARIYRAFWAAVAVIGVAGIAGITTYNIFLLSSQ